MKYLIGLLFLALTLSTDVVFDFYEDVSLRNWRIVDDVVMGGRSNGTFELTSEGHGIFSGDISLENNGGFSSVRYQFRGARVNESTRVQIRLKGDGKRYQFRVKHTLRAYYSYEKYFTTSGDWQVIEIPVKEMYPAFRGNRLNIPNFNHDTIQEVTFLFGNKKPEPFQLLIDEIVLVSD
jgi:hypothetical protein